MHPEAPWVSPANGYPPVYPLLLAPVYWRWGLDLRAMKVMTVFTFAIFLATFAKWVQPLVSPKLRVIAVILVGLNPAFWNYRDLIASEFPYLMICFLTLVAIRHAYADLEIAKWRPGWLAWWRSCCTSRTAHGPSGSHCRLRWRWRTCHNSNEPAGF
jgi:hypothetical protein